MVNELYPNDPYINETYFPFGYGQLTQKGKQREYLIGKALRKKYDSFLGDIYYPEIVEAWSTDFDRTKMSLELVLASLFPPNSNEKLEDFLNWQPIPYIYEKQNLDKILLGDNCSYYRQLYFKNQETLEERTKFKKYQTDADYISNNTGLEVTSFFQIYDIFSGLKCIEDWGFAIPSWALPMWPEKMNSLAGRQYLSMTATKELKQMAVGYLLQKIIEDTRNTIKNIQHGRKIYLYSAHELNIAFLLIALDFFENPHMPEFGAYIVFEIHKIHDIYGIQIFHQNYRTSEPELIKIKGCNSFCPLDVFVSLLEEFIPTEDICNKT